MNHVVVIEGADATGKDFVKSALDRKTGFEHTCVVRFGISSLVYARYFRRPMWEDPKQRRDYVAMLRRFLKSVRPLYVHLTADQGTIDRRLVAKGEDPAGEKPSEVVERLYEEAYELVGFPRWQLLILNTAGDPQVSELVSIIESRIRTIEERRY